MSVWRRVVSRAKDYVQRVKDGRPPLEFPLYRFESLADVQQWQTFADSEYGGMSTASLQQQGDHAELHGALSTNLREDFNTDGSLRALRRSGFCGMRTNAEDLELDLEAYDTLEFRVRGDGRKYVATLRTDAWINVPGAAQDMWQAFLFAPRDEWADVQIPMARFLKTWRGRVLDGENEMNARRVLSLGISLAGGGALEPPGPYRLGLKHIVARIGARQTQRE